MKWGGMRIKMTATVSRAGKAILIGTIITLVLGFPGMVQGRSRDEKRAVSLGEAIRIARENSLSLAASRMDVEDSRLGLSQAEAENLINPSPASLVQARNALEIAERKLVMERFSTDMAVEEDFYNVLRTADYVEVGTKALKLAERQLSVARSKFAAGSGTQGDVIAALSKVAESRASLAKAKGSYDLALLKFRQTLGVPLDSNVCPEDQTFTFEEYLPDLESDIEFALENRVEILEVQGGIDAARTQVEVLANDYTPELALKRARVAEQKAINGLDQLRYGIELEVRQAHLSLVDLSRRLEAQRENVAEAEENLRIAQKLLEASMATSDQIMAAEVGLAQARMNARHTLFDYNLAKLKYDKAAARPLLEVGDDD